MCVYDVHTCVVCKCVCFRLSSVNLLFELSYNHTERNSMNGFCAIQWKGLHSRASTSIRFQSIGMDKVRNTWTFPQLCLCFLWTIIIARRNTERNHTHTHSDVHQIILRSKVNMEWVWICFRSEIWKKSTHFLCKH